MEHTRGFLLVICVISAICEAKVVLDQTSEKAEFSPSKFNQESRHEIREMQKRGIRDFQEYLPQKMREIFFSKIKKAAEIIDKKSSIFFKKFPSVGPSYADEDPSQGDPYPWAEETDYIGQPYKGSSYQTSFSNQPASSYTSSGHSSLKSSHSSSAPTYASSSSTYSQPSSHSSLSYSGPESSYSRPVISQSTSGAESSRHLPSHGSSYGSTSYAGPKSSVSRPSTSYLRPSTSSSSSLSGSSSHLPSHGNPMTPQSSKSYTGSGSHASSSPSYTKVRYTSPGSSYPSSDHFRSGHSSEGSHSASKPMPSKSSHLDSSYNPSGSNQPIFIPSQPISRPSESTHGPQSSVTSGLGQSQSSLGKSASDASTPDYVIPQGLGDLWSMLKSVENGEVSEQLMAELANMLEDGPATKMDKATKMAAKLSEALGAVKTGSSTKNDANRDYHDDMMDDKASTLAHIMMMKDGGSRIMPVIGDDNDDDEDDNDENDEDDEDDDNDEGSGDEEEEDDDGLTSDDNGFTSDEEGFTSDEGDFASYDNGDDVAGLGPVVASSGVAGQIGLGVGAGQTGLGASDQLVAYLVTDADNPDVQFLVPATALPANYKPHVP